MRRFPSAILLATLRVMLFPHPAPTQDKPATACRCSAVTGARGEFLAELAFYEQRYTRLAEAIPPEKYSWRPAEGVRSIGEVTPTSPPPITASLAPSALPPAASTPKPSTPAPRQSQNRASPQRFPHPFPGRDSRIKDADLNNPLNVRADTTVRGAFFPRQRT